MSPSNWHSGSVICSTSSPPNADTKLASRLALPTAARSRSAGLNLYSEISECRSTLSAEMALRESRRKSTWMRSFSEIELSAGCDCCCELYYIIRNGVPMTGMPACGDVKLGNNDTETWVLVSFIRHLPSLTAEEQSATE